jgi:cytochrome d ubiquinol oxidase subunit I
MFESINPSLVDWSRAQFALTALYHWIFVPLTLGLGLIMGIMETMYYRTHQDVWKRTAQFWMKLFGINFAIGVATGLILEFEFGTNWSNYSWLVGDIFGAPLAIEGILAFFMEATFIAVMFFGWNKVGRGFHLASTWLTGIGATISAWWILVANAWMQYPVGMSFNPNTMRNEMTDFVAVAFSPVAVNKFFHAVISGWLLAAVFVVGISCWYLLKNRQKVFALRSLKVATLVGLTASLLSLWTGDGSAYQVAQTQPMKFAAMEGLYNGTQNAGLVAFGLLNPKKTSPNDGKDPFLFRIEMPSMLSVLSERDANMFVPGVNNLLDGGYKLKDGSRALSIEDKIACGKTAISALSAYRAAKKAKYEESANVALHVLHSSIQYIGYGYLKSPQQVVPNIPVNFYAFRMMVMLGLYFICFFIVTTFTAFKRNFANMRWLQWVALWSIPFAYMAGMAGWVVTEMGRQPWMIQDMLPTNAGVSRLSTTSVEITFFIFLLFFTVMLIAGIKIMLKAIKKGPEIQSEI